MQINPLMIDGIDQQRSTRRLDRSIPLFTPIAGNGHKVQRMAETKMYPVSMRGKFNAKNGNVKNHCYYNVFVWTKRNMHMYTI